jgi:glyoxylase-like metal-dependent hydrolase (beta-lactamase superfamily II)
MIQPRVHTGGIAATNAYLLTLPGGTLVIDAPEGTADWLRRLGVRPDVLLLTHQHFDHVMDAAALKREFGCRIVAWSAYSRDLTLELLFSAVSGMSVNVPPFEVDDVLEGKSTLEAAGEVWSLLHIPGHSPDSVCFHHEAEKTVFGGDVLFECGVGRTDFPGGSHTRLITGIVEKLMPLDDATVVFPGHGDSTTIGAERMGNPYLEL